MFRGKKYQDSAKQIDKATLYDAAEAMDLIVKTAPAKFDETVELHVKLGVDSRHADQQVRGAIVLPHGTGKVPRVLVFAKGDKADAAKEAGADYVGEADLAQKIQQENWFDFDVVIASPDMMSVVGRLGKVLGPKGLMPSPKAGTVTPNVAGAVQEAKAGKVEYRLDKTNIIHCPIGKVSFGAEKLGENFTTLMGAIIAGGQVGGLEAPGRPGQRDGVGCPLHRRRRPGRALRLGVPRDLEPGAGEGRPAPGGVRGRDPLREAGHRGREAPDPGRPGEGGEVTWPTPSAAPASTAP